MLQVFSDGTKLVMRDPTGAQKDRTLPIGDLLSSLADGGLLTRNTSPADIGAAPAGASSGVLGITIDGGGAAIETGLKGFLLVPYACRIVGWAIVADQAGSCVVDVWKKAGAVPSDAESITAAAPPTLAAAQLASGTTLTGWTVAVAAGDVIGFNVDSAATVQRVTVQLEVVKL